MEQKKQISYFWLYNFLPIKIVKFLELIRFEKPIGFLLLMWPCWFALANFSITSLKWYVLFFLGSFFMRSVGCIINDYFDRFIDKEVDRTSKRPLASGDVSFLEAILVMVPLLLFSLIILMYFNTFAIIITLASLPLVIMYPLMKRITYWPQLFLGLTFSWGVLIVAAQFQEFISIDSILLYIGCVFWTLGYDTIYSYQDRKDDIKIKLKSTAILFNDKGKFFVIFFYLMFAIFLFFSTSLKLIESK